MQKLAISPHSDSSARSQDGLMSMSVPTRLFFIAMLLSFNAAIWYCLIMGVRHLALLGAQLL